VVTWSTILEGCAMHGHGKEALKYFEQMKKVYSQMISLLFVFCQLVAMQVWWMKARAFMVQWS
jgi:pentatricopeptide repeat protein